MDRQNWDIADLLALRDGELRDAGIDERDPRIAQALAQVREIRSNLQSLPDVPVSDAVWESVLDRIDADHPDAALHSTPSTPRTSRTTVHWLRFPLATAASVFFASIIGVYFLFSEPGGPDGQSLQGQFAGSTAQLEPGGLRLAGLMNRSQDLEQRLRGSASFTQASGQVTAPATQQSMPTLTELRLMGRLADVDAQIGRLYEAEQVDPVQRERLWTQRVNLLESLVAVRGGRDARLLEDALSLEDMRSM